MASIGCSTKTTPTIEHRPDYCNLTPIYKYTQEELEYRAKNWPTNLRREIVSNKNKADLCP